MKSDERRALGWAWAIGGAATAMVSLFAAAILSVVLYSTVIRPGGNEEFYRDYARRASPVVCTVAGIPLFFLISWWIGRRTSVRPVATAFLTWCLFITLDQSMVLALGESSGWGSLLGWTSYATKLIAVIAGGAVARRISGRAPVPTPIAASSAETEPTARKTVES